MESSIVFYLSLSYYLRKNIHNMYFKKYFICFIINECIFTKYYVMIVKNYIKNKTKKVKTINSLMNWIMMFFNSKKGFFGLTKDEHGKKMLFFFPLQILQIIGCLYGRPHLLIWNYCCPVFCMQYLFLYVLSIYFLDLLGGLLLTIQCKKAPWWIVLNFMGNKTIKENDKYVILKFVLIIRKKAQ